MGCCLDTAEIFDPNTGTWQTTPMPLPRVPLAAVVLNDGRVLVMGGTENVLKSTFSADIYDPTSNTWKPTADMHWRRDQGAAVVLEDDRVLVTGGFNAFASDGSKIILPTAEVFDETLDISERSWLGVRGVQ